MAWTRCRSSGSGFIVDAGGVILTNAHVIMDGSGRQPATGITVTLQDGRIYEVRVSALV
jgi:S1-C subfamily serine protease